MRARASGSGWASLRLAWCCAVNFTESGMEGVSRYLLVVNRMYHLLTIGVTIEKDTLIAMHQTEYA